MSQKKSPYIQTAIFADNDVALKAADLRRRRDPLRCLSSLLPKMPFYFSAIYEVPSLYDWLVEKLDPVSEDGDFLFDFARYLDWWERTGVYQDVDDGKERKKNKEIRLLIRRFGLEDKLVSPAPDQFLAIQGKGTMTWTDTHQWLLLLRFFDILVYLRGVDVSDTTRIAPSPRRLIALTSSLTQSWLSMRVDWQAALKASAACVQAANGVTEWSPIVTVGQGALGGRARIGGASTSDGAIQSAAAQAAPQRLPAEEEMSDAGSPSREAGSSGGTLHPAPVDVPVKLAALDELFAKFDEMKMTAAFERILPSVKSADEQGQYLAICVNIQLAALVINFIQSNAREGAPPFQFSDITDHIPEDVKASWKTARYIYQPFMLMLSYTPIFLLARTRLYSSPLPSFSVALEIFKGMGNVGKPGPLQALEKSLWALTLQVSKGASVHELLPVYVSLWISDIDNQAVAECKSWLDDFGLKEGAEKSGPIQDWDEEDEIKVVHEYTAHRDELRDWKPDLNEQGKRRRSSPEPNDRPKKAATRDKVAPRAPPPTRTRPRGRAPRDRSASRAQSDSPERDDEDPRVDLVSGDEQPGLDSDRDMLTGRLSPMSDIEEPYSPPGTEEPGAVSESGENGEETEPPQMDIDYGLPLPGPGPSFVPPVRARNGRSRQDNRALSDDSAAPARSAARKSPPQEQPYEPVPVSVPIWTANGMEQLTWSPLRKKTFDMFQLLSENVVTQYAPGTEQSGICVLSAQEFKALSSREVSKIFAKQSILIRGGQINPVWSWGLEAFSKLRPIHGTIVQVQDPIASYADPEVFDTVFATLPDLVRAGKENTGQVWNCLDIPLGERRLVNIPHVSDLDGFNLLPFLHSVASQDSVAYKSEDVRGKMHWALAGVAGADTLQHVDTGGYATAVHVLSGRKLWAVGSRRSGAAFADYTHALAKKSADQDWQSLDAIGMTWECAELGPGDTFLMRPGPHVVHTSESSICYGEYMLAPCSLADHFTSYALTRIADLVATNDRIDDAPMLNSIASWWWDGDIAAGDDNFDPSARASRPALDQDPRAYVALLGFNVFQTTLAVVSYDKDVIRKLGLNLDAVPERLYWDATQCLYQWMLRQGVFTRRGEEVGQGVKDEERVELLRELVLDFGRGLYIMAVQHNKSEEFFNVAAFRKRLANDALAAFNLHAKDWLDDVSFEPRSVIPHVVFVSSPRPTIKFSFHK